MKRIVYYISEYGYGHAARSIAIIRELLKDSEVQIQIVNQYALDFIKKSLPQKNVSFYNVSTDIGFFLKKDSIEPDFKRQHQETENYFEGVGKLINSELERLSQSNIDLIISDISPVAFEIADQLGIPSVGISNFTWYTAFEKLVPAQILAPLKESYRKMDYYFALAGCNNEEWARIETIYYGFYSRKVDYEEVYNIRSNIEGNKKIVFLGLGMKMELNDLQNYPIWNSPNTHFIISSNLCIEHENVSNIPFNYLETQNYIASCDLVITKAGWGTVGEAVASGVPMLIIEREGMREDENTINYLKDSKLAKTISWDGFKGFQLDPEFYEELNDLNRNNRTSLNKITDKLLEITNHCTE